MRLFLLLVLLPAVAAACSWRGREEGAETTADEAGIVVEGIRLVPVPPAALARCRRGELVGPACTELVPDSRWRDRPGWTRERGSFPLGQGAFELGAGAEHPGRPDQDRPPRLVHLIVLAGRVAAAFDFAWPGPDARRVAARDGLYAARRKRAVLLGRPAWAGRNGDLVLAPPFEAGGGINGNHLVFRWREGGTRYALSLHGWEPFSETVPVLRALVESLPSRRQ
jgi:hypothetical protein